MKTLDEVIKAYEICHASVLSCEGCPYDNGERWRDSDCYLTDALHYLKHLQEYYEMSREHHEPNPPLTWQELQQMEGKHVWVETKKFGNHWYLIEEINDNDNIVIFVGKYHERVRFYHDDLVVSWWQAYRKERGE